jgi:hypothetical protein
MKEVNNSVSNNTQEHTHISIFNMAAGTGLYKHTHMEGTN